MTIVLVNMSEKEFKTMPISLETKKELILLRDKYLAKAEAINEILRQESDDNQVLSKPGQPSERGQGLHCLLAGRCAGTRNGAEVHPTDG